MPKKEGIRIPRTKALQFNELSPFVISGDLGNRAECQGIDAVGACNAQIWWYVLLIYKTPEYLERFLMRALFTEHLQIL
jgi:hypothetical protein